jgi:hypothetical protein
VHPGIFKNYILVKKIGILRQHTVMQLLLYEEREEKFPDCRLTLQLSERASQLGKSSAKSTTKG